MTTTGPATDAVTSIAEALRHFRNEGPSKAVPAPGPELKREAAPGPPRERIHHPLPNGDIYYARTVDSSTDVEVLRRNRGTTIRDNLYVLLTGRPGTGKSRVPLAAFGEELIVIEGDGDTSVDEFLGGWVQNPDGTYGWVDGPLVVAAENGWPLFIDEIAQISPKVMACVYAAMDGRGRFTIKSNHRRGTIIVKDGFYVVGACNPDAPGAKMSEALLSRFLIHLEATTDYDLAKHLGVPSKAVTAAKNLAVRRDEKTCGWAPEMRELLAFRDAAERMGITFAVANMIGASPADSRPIVADALSRAFGSAVAPLRMGPGATR